MITSAFAKVGLCLGALFLCGGVCGFTVANRRLANPAARDQMEERWIEGRLREDTRRLQLTPEQVAQVRPLYEQMRADLRAVREEAARGVMAAAKKQSGAVRSFLTPAQQQEFSRLNDERRARLPKGPTR
jgi:Spy/CpxP family protein refolding chaperone